MKKLTTIEKGVLYTAKVSRSKIGTCIGCLARFRITPDTRRLDPMCPLCDPPGDDYECADYSGGY